MAIACPNFEALKDLHNSANNLLYSPMIQQGLVHDRQEKWVHQVSEASLRMLDVCGISKDLLLMVKERLRDLQSLLRRVSSDQEADIDNKMGAYNCYRKKLKQETLKCLNSFKGIKKNKSSMCICTAQPLLESSPIYMDHNLRVVVDVLRQVRVTAVSIVETLLSLISIPWLDRKSATSTTKSIFIKAKFMLYDICDATALQSASKRLDAVEIAIQDLEAELDCMFRRLIHTRVALLNILTTTN
ncbi:PREDICTED: uncharacterized protein LOC103321370 [Prunus mume]|uniref:Uncharacterized protein LOC103321370 n=1 Tax=Prunus mume TaxID=102107 RepID=A0ABM1LHY8_PRUMU|nr:PREDICTED: uncharacterized protein LOC103321370 [Prunus mume]